MQTHYLPKDKTLHPIEDSRQKVKKIFQTLSNQSGPPDAISLQIRVDLVRLLETTLRTRFRNTREMKREIEDYLRDHDGRRRPIHLRIKHARKKKKWTQTQFAENLGYKSHVSIAQFEKGKRYPPKEIFQWLEEEGM